MSVSAVFSRAGFLSALPSVCAGLLLLGCAGCERIPFLAGSAPARPLAEVLPGRWSVTENGLTGSIAFGTHSEMSLVVDVPPQYRARIGVEQIWAGGNYHVDGQTIHCQLTDGRWAVALAQTQGLPVRQLPVARFTDDEVVLGSNITWKRTGPAPESHAGAVDIAGHPLPGAAVPPTVRAPFAAEQARPKKLQAEQARLNAVYLKLDARRKALDAKNPAAVAAFNRDAADYTRQVSALYAATPPPAAAH